MSDVVINRIYAQIIAISRLSRSLMLTAESLAHEGTAYDANVINQWARQTMPQYEPGRRIRKVQHEQLAFTDTDHLV